MNFAISVLALINSLAALALLEFLDLTLSFMIKNHWPEVLKRLDSIAGDGLVGETS